MFDENEEEPIISPDTENATHFHAVEAPPEQRKKYSRFHGYNTGLYNGEWANKAELRRVDNLGLYDAISSQLEMTNYQKQVGRGLFDSLNLKLLGYRASLVAFCVCAYVCRQDGRIYHPKRSDRNNDTEFLRLAEQLDVKETKIEACLNRVSKELP